MRPDLSLKENVIHGTREHPVSVLHFTAGKGTPWPEHFFVKRHWHDYVEIIYIVKGNYFVEINLQEHLLKEGDLCILNSGEPHQITGTASEGIHDVILFTPRILDFSYADEWEENYIAPFLKQDLIFQNILHPEDAGYEEMLSVFQKAAETGLQQTPGWYLPCKLRILEFFSLAVSYQMLQPAEKLLDAASTRKIDRYKTIVTYMERHYQEPLSLEQLSGLISCNSQYLCRFFREIAGVSPIRYLITYRLERACSLLIHTRQPVTDIALECGFENISYFIRKFREEKGCTPREYRRTHLRTAGAAAEMKHPTAAPEVRMQEEVYTSAEENAPTTFLIQAGCQSTPQAETECRKPAADF